MTTLRAVIDAYETRGTREVGASCKHGHERAVWERTYANRTRTIRRCLLCTRAAQKRARLAARAASNAVAAWHPDDARWAAFCRSIGERIERVRAEQADPICGTCGSTTPVVVTAKWCSGCQLLLAVERFARDRARPDGRNVRCRACESVRGKAYRTRRAVLGRSA